MERREHNRSGVVPGPCAHAVGNTAEDEGVIVHGVLERKKRDDDL